MKERERETLDKFKQQCKMEKVVMEEERARLLKEHAPCLLGHLPSVCVFQVP